MARRITARLLLVALVGALLLGCDGDPSPEELDESVSADAPEDGGRADLEQGWAGTSREVEQVARAVREEVGRGELGAARRTAETCGTPPVNGAIATTSVRLGGVGQVQLEALLPVVRDLGYDPEVVQPPNEKIPAFLTMSGEAGAIDVSVERRDLVVTSRTRCFPVSEELSRELLRRYGR